MRLGAWTLLALLGLILTAGCIGLGDDAEEETDIERQARVTEDTGGIEGVAVDPAVEGIPEASVTIKETGASTETAMDGSFAFSELPPDTYTLTVQAEDHLPTEQEVDVSPNEVTFVEIVLTEEPTLKPYMTQHDFTGFIECSARIGPPPDPAPGIYYGRAVCATPNSLLGGSVTNDRFMFTYEIEPDPWQMVSELRWDEDQDLAERFSVRVEPIGIANDRSTEFGGEWDTSPMHILTDRERFHEVDQNTAEACEGGSDSYCDRNYVEDGGDAQIRVFVSNADPMPAGVAIQEEYDIVISTFYHAPACEDFTVMQGNTCPQEAQPRMEDPYEPDEEDEEPEANEPG